MVDVLQKIANGKRPRLPSFLTDIPIDELGGLTLRLRRDALGNFFRRLAVDGTTKLPPILSGVIQKAVATKTLKALLQEAARQKESPNWGGWAVQVLSQRMMSGDVPQVPMMCLVEAAIQQYLQEVEEARKQAPETQTHWDKPAFYFLSRATRSQNAVEEIWDTPWRQAVSSLQIKWQGPSFDYEQFAVVPSNFSAFLASWVAQNGVLSEPNEKTKELARLSEAGVEHELLRDMESKFPGEAEDWFGAADPSAVPVQRETTDPTKQSDPKFALLRIFTNGIVDEKIILATQLLENETLNTNEKLIKINNLIRFPSTASLQQLGDLLGVSKQAVIKTAWWIENRKGEKGSEKRSCCPTCFASSRSSGWPNQSH
jgi:hypothetical protein